MSNVRWALRRALRDRDLYDPRQRVRIDLDEIAHPADIAARRAEFRDWGAFYDDLAGLGATFKPRNVLQLGVRLGYSAYCLCSGSLLAGARRVRLTGTDAETDVGPPTYGYRTLAAAAETFRRFLPEVRTAFYCHDVTRDGLPPEAAGQRFQLVHLDLGSTPEGTLVVLRLAWGVLAPGGILAVSRTYERSDVIADLLTWLVEEDGSPFSSQHIHNDVGMGLFRRDLE